MKKKFFMIMVVACLLSMAFTQPEATQQTETNEQIEKVRAESGLDPTKSVTKIGTATWILTPEGQGTQIRQNFNVQAAVGTWNFTLQTQLFSSINGNTRTYGWTDLEFSVANVPFSFGKHSIGFITKLNLPTGSNNISTGQFIITPGMVYVYAPTNSIIIAVQPQYSISAVKPTAYPMTSLLTMRIFGAAFTSTGFTGVFEVRPLYDFTINKFNLILSPIVSFNLGKGFTVNLLVELPVMPEFWKKDQPVYKFGLQKSF